MEAYFGRFGLDIGRLCHELGQSLDSLLPEIFDDLRPAHILQLMDFLDIESRQYLILRSILTPRELLNQGDNLRSRIWRFIEFKNPLETEQNTIVRSLLLRVPHDVLFNEENSLVMYQSKKTPDAFRGASFFLHFPKSGSTILHTQPNFPSLKDLAALEKKIKAQHRVTEVRSVLGLYLDAGDEVPSADWIVDFDDIDPGHVTMAVANANGLPAYCPATMTRNVRVDALETLPWKRDANLLVLKAEAEWRDDFLPDDYRWRNIVCVLNMILLYGDMDHFFAVWCIHEMLHRNAVGQFGKDVHRDVVQHLQRIYDVLRSFEMSDRHDINDPARDLYQAIADVCTLIAIAENSQNNFKPHMLLWHSRVMLKDGLTGDPVDVDIQDSAFLNELDSALRLSPLHAVVVAGYGSLHYLANEKLPEGDFPIIARGKSFMSTVAKPERVLVDEICTLAEGGRMASVRIRDQVVHLLPSGLEYLRLVDNTVDEENAFTDSAAATASVRVTFSRRCVGTSLKNQPCGNMSLLMYRLDAAHPWMSLCWRHKQQVLALAPLAPGLVSINDSKTFADN